MIDGRSTTDDWQTHTGSVCVLPVGSFEQHGSHLPLATDILCAEHFARMLADDLPAALLPALPFGTCAEHSGFRGSVSLRPETLMQIIRDVADEMERQQFRVLVLLNGHGGNFALGPVARDINRTDRSLKLLLVDWWEHAITVESRDRGPDLHAGEMETSVMQALHPHLVRPNSSDRLAPGSREDFPLVQRDLNTFGIGHLSPNGIVGYPSLASAEKGQAILQSVRARLLPYVRDRVRRLTEQPRYAGPGGISLRPMEIADMAAGMRLKTLAGWNQTENDWRIFLSDPAARSFAAVHDGRVVGTVAALHYGTGDDDLGWIGMLLVDPDFRRQGVGWLLLQRAVDELTSCRAVKLDATPEGQALYKAMGFGAESRLRRVTHACLPALPPSPADSVLQPITEETWPGVAALDRAVFGADRTGLLQTLAAGDPLRALCLTRAGRVEGFCLGRGGASYHQVGPLIAVCADNAVLLTRAALRGLSGRPVVLDVPDAAPPEFARWLSDLGFNEQRPFLRMVRGSVPAPALNRLFAICGPEFG